LASARYFDDEPMPVVWLPSEYARCTRGRKRQIGERHMAYRYRWNGGTTAGARKRFDRILANLGPVKEIRGYRFLGRFKTQHEAIMVKGENGTARFSGLLWGYGGEAPKATVELLRKLGIHQEVAEHYIFNTERSYPHLGNDWILTFLPGSKVRFLTRAMLATGHPLVATRKVNNDGTLRHVASEGGRSVPRK
jgi:hypothetical protein